MVELKRKISNLFDNRWMMLTIVLVGFGLRLIVSLIGHNYDLNSFLMVIDILEKGDNVYANTYRYNYGPIWFSLLYQFYQLASRDQELFRYVLIIFLSFVDLGIFAVLCKKLGNFVGALFLLHPISVIITGYHNQFDNFALLLGMLSVLLIGDSHEQPVNLRKVSGLLILGVSLVTKHIFFLFPFWLAIKQKGILQKILVIGVPLMLFFSSFIPFWSEGSEGIITHVFLYDSEHHQPFYRWFVPKIIQEVISSRDFWMLTLVVFAFIFRKRNNFDSLLYYTAILVAISPAMANQYLAIVIPFVVANINPFTILFSLVGTWFLLVDQAGLNSEILKQIFNFSNYIFYFYFLVPFLCFGIIYSAWKTQVKALFRTLTSIVLNEMKIQIGLDIDN